MRTTAFRGAIIFVASGSIHSSSLTPAFAMTVPRPIDTVMKKDSGDSTLNTSVGSTES